MKFKKVFAMVLLTLSLVSCGENSSVSASSIYDTSSEESSVTSYVTSSEISSETSYETSSSKTLTYKNPIKSVGFADPYVIKADDGYYYAYSTEGSILRSRDMVTWDGRGSISTPTWGSPGAHIWAPCVKKIGDNYLYYYALSAWGDADPSIGIMYSTSPAGPFTDVGKLFDSNSIGVTNSIDPDLFFDEASQAWWIMWGSFAGIYVNQLSHDGFSLVGSKYQIAGSSWEGSNMLQKDGKYYLFLSTGSCCNANVPTNTYNVRIGVSDSLLGPYKDSDGYSLSSSHLGNLVIQGDHTTTFGPGHSCVLEDEGGNYWLFYHSYYKYKVSYTDRIFFMDKLLWDENGFPYVYGQVPSLTNQLAPTI